MAIAGNGIERFDVLKTGVRRSGVDARSSEPSPELTPFVDPLPISSPPHPVAPFASGDRREDDAGASAAAFYHLVQEQAPVSLHADLPRSRVWRYRDAAADAAPAPGMLGPTFKCRMAEPPAAGGGVVIRIKNALPDPHRGFGLNCTSTHLLGGHVAEGCDGFPEDPADEIDYRPVIGPGECFDYRYALRDVGHSAGMGDPGERPSTLVYRDNLLDFAAPNVYRGLAGLFLVFDEFDADDEHGQSHPETNLRLPSGKYDVPLLLRDVRIDAEGQLAYVPYDRNGVLGDTYLVNGKVQPFLAVERRKYRFRVVNGSTARLFALQLADRDGRSQRFDYVIATGGGLLAGPVPDADHVLLAASERRELVVDFRRFPPGAELYLVDGLAQESACGPGGSCATPDMAEPERRRALLKFVVADGAPEDPSRVPERLRPFAARSPDSLAGARRRTFEFTRKNGVWSINGVVADIDAPLWTVQREETEVWTLGNPTEWWLPIRVSRAFMRVSDRNGGAPLACEADGIGRTDCVLLAPGDRVDVSLRFRDYPGRALMTSGNLALADAFLRARFDVL